MKNAFEIPKLEIVLIASDDILTTSDLGVAGEDVWTPWLEL